MALDLTALGGFFAAETHPATSVPRGPWRSMAELIENPAVLAERVDQVRGTLAAGRPLAVVPVRVAASVCQLGLATRVLSPALAAATVGQPIDLAWPGLRWQPGSGGAFPLSVQRGDAELVDQVLSALTELAEVSRVSPVIFWGNVSSAINGAATMLARLHPELAEDGYLIARSVLAGLPYASTDRPVGPGFRRRSCCLLYRASPYGRAAICPDCVLG